MSIPSKPPRPEVEAYQRAFEAALYGNPGRAARLAGLERAVGSAESEEEARAAATEVHYLLREVSDELAPAWPQVWYSGKTKPE